MAKQNDKGGRKKKFVRPVDPLSLAPLQTVLDHLGVPQANWDVVIVGDGSGSTWANGCGWASVLVDKETKQRQLFYGAMSSGTVALSEIMPYLHCLMWYENARKTWLKINRDLPIRVHVITDNKLTADQGNNLVARNANSEIWSAIEDIEHRGYHITWHWMARNGTELNALTDYVSKSSRITLGSMSLPDNADIYSVNPETVA